MNSQGISCLKRHALSFAVTSACFASFAVMADGQQVAIGTDLTVPGGEYKTAGNGEHAFWASQGGTLVANAPVTIHTEGLSASAVRAQNAGSMIRLTDAEITTAGDNSIGLNATSGGRITVNGGTGPRAVIATTGAYATGAVSDGNGSGVGLINVGIYTLGRGAEGLRTDNGGHALLLGTDIWTDGMLAHAVYADYGSSVDLDQTSLHTRGNDARGLNILNGSDARVSNAQIMTEGREAQGVYLGSNSSAAIADSNIITSGDFAYGAMLDGNGARLTLDNVLIDTHGGASSAIWAAREGTITGNGVDLRTSGDAAMGVDNRASNIVLDNASIHTTGSSAYGLYAFKQGEATAAINANNIDIHTEGANSYGAYAYKGGAIALSNGNVTTSGANASALVAANGSTIDVSRLVIETTGAGADGLVANGNDTNGSAIRSQIRTAGEDAAGVVAVAGGHVQLAQTDVHTEGANAWAGVVDGVGSELNMDGGSLVAVQSGALLASGGTTITANNGAQLIGGNGLLLGVTNTSDERVNFNLDNQSIGIGDIAWSNDKGERQSSGALVDALLDRGSQWKGSTTIVDALSLTNGSAWTLTDSSRVNTLQLNDSIIAFETPNESTYKTLNIGGDLAGTGGTIALNTYMDEGGALGNQHTDRVLIQGDVATTGTTYLSVTPQGNGALTDTNQNGKVDANEGISLVQVGGSSRADAFALRGGYVAAGPWQYTLHAFGPGETDPDQSLLPSGTTWDYRLGNKYVEEPGKPGPGPDPGDERPAVIPQLPSYVVAPTALMNYGQQVTNTLHQRLGEIRNVPPDDGVRGEVFARLMAGQHRYASDRSFSDYGYDFDQQINALQLGGSLLGWTGDRSSLRTGWAADKGTTRVTPHAADGNSRTKYDAHGVSAWMTWQQDNGLYVDGVVGGETYRGKVGTDARGESVATIRAHGWTASVEAGYPFEVAKGWSVEPQAQLQYQSLRFQDINDVDGTLTRIAPIGQTTARIGARIVKTDDAKLAPYARVDLMRSVGKRPKITTSSEAWNASQAFDGGRIGTGYRVGAGLSSQLTRNLALYGEGNYQHGIGSSGFSGWSANMGIRVNF